MSRVPVLYLGDTGLDGAASYLAGVMMHFGIRFDYGASDEPADRFLAGGTAERGSGYRLFILSDYPAGNLEPEQMERIAASVRRGSGLLMIGGWESFQGSGGGYSGTRIEEILPVRMSAHDDRVNCPFPCLVHKREEHPILSDLPFHTPPGIGGYNRITPRAGGRVLLEAIRFRTEVQGGVVTFSEQGRDPLLVVGSFAEGRCAAFASDVAPHWVGGFVDWGQERIPCRSAGGEVEVGEYYAAFFLNLIRWSGRL